MRETTVFGLFGDWFLWLHGWCDGGDEKNLPGGDSAVVPPDPMPNSEVKRRSADGSVGSPHARVGNCQASYKEPPVNAGVFCHGAGKPALRDTGQDRRRSCVRFYGPGRSGLVLSPALCCAPALCLSRFPCDTFSLSPSLRGFYHSASTE